MADFNKLMEMVTDFGVDSLRVGSYEARKNYEGHTLDWKLSMLRDKRQESRERIAQALWEVCNQTAVSAEQRVVSASPER
jgi:tRNA A37 methylthiotransferase MiaB